MELETDAIIDDYDVKGKRKLRSVHRKSKARKTILSFQEKEPTKTETTESAAVPPSNKSSDVSERIIHRGARLVSEWTVGRCPPDRAIQTIEETVSLGLRCLDYYGYIDEKTNMPDAETVRLRLLCLGDRFVAAMGGVLGPTQSLSGMLFVALIVLLKSWSDYGIHLKLFEWKSMNIASVAELELQYLTAIKFKTHISHRNVFDFTTRLRLLP
jgi:hypothetical protein